MDAGVPDDRVAMERAISAQVELDASGAERLRDEAAQREAGLAHEYLARRIAAGSSPVQVMQGFAKALGYAIGTLVRNESHAPLLLGLFDIMEDNRSAAVRQKLQAAGFSEDAPGRVSGGAGEAHGATVASPSWDPPNPTPVWDM